MSKSRKQNLLLFAIPFLITFAFYLLTVCRQVYIGDAGELSFTIYTMSIAHPPGYPLLTLLGKLFLFFVPGNVGHVLNCLSALLSAGTAGIAAHVIRNVLFVSEARDEINSIAISIAAAILWGFCNALWATAVGFEVYSLGMFLMLLSFFALFRYVETRNQNFLIASAYFFFLGLTNHLTVAAMFLPILLTLISRKAPLIMYILLFGFFLIAISAYLYIPIRSAQHPIGDWDHPATLGPLLDHITAKRYRSYISGFRLDNYLQNIWRSISILAQQFPIGLGVLGIIGFFVVPNFSRRTKLFFMLIFFFNFLTVAIYDIPDIDQYYLPTFFLSVIGIAGLITWLFNRYPVGWMKWSGPAVLAIIIIATINMNYSRNDQSHNNLTYTYGMDIMNSVPQGSIIISVADNSNSSLYYLHYVENVRPDLEIYDAAKTYGMLKDRLNLQGKERDISGQELCSKMISTYPEKSYLVKEHVLRKGSSSDYENMPLKPQGMVYRVGNLPTDMSVWDKIKIPSTDEMAGSIEIRGMTMLCNLHLCKGEDLQQMGDTTEAVAQFRQARQIAELSREASVHNSLGVFFRRHGWPMFAEEEYRSALDSHHLTGFEKANILINVANLQKDRGGLIEAINLYKQALKINPDNKDGRYNLAIASAYLALNQKQPAYAAEQFEKALAIWGPDPKLYFNLGVIYDKSLNDTTRALDNYRQFIGMTPDRPEAKDIRQRIAELSHGQ
jgi:tetratricopeptide (TPR) repeat protein